MFLFDVRVHDVHINGVILLLCLSRCVECCRCHVGLNAHSDQCLLNLCHAFHVGASPVIHMASSTTFPVKCGLNIHIRLADKLCRIRMMLLDRCRWSDAGPLLG